MEFMSDSHLQLLLSKEWLVQTDPERSIPYLLKFYASMADLTCFVMITDTKHVWGEVLSSNSFARRWRNCNPQSPPPFKLDSEEDSWREDILDVLIAAHSIGRFTDLSFEIVQSKNADLAFELGGDGFKWIWETYGLGPKVSADVISKQLIMPLISLNHLAYTSPDPVSEVSEGNLEKAIDKAGRAARRTWDTHVKQAISRPRLVTSMRRMTAVCNFLSEFPPILSKVDPPEIRVPVARQKSPQLASSSSAARPTVSNSPGPSSRILYQPPPEKNEEGTKVSKLASQAAAHESATATEDEAEEQPPPVTSKEKGKKSSSPGPHSRQTRTPNSPKRVSAVASRPPSPGPTTARKAPSTDPDPTSEPTSQPRARKVKRSRVSSSSSDSDSEAERKKRLAQVKAGTKQAIKQPLKRTARRF
ncbi:hypothetical protein K474DRAFT_1714102 [Panus rudis PR-1116 ss-1]|nr:hypothetical protein K474DRAFT_1714102 [Panus rudis PR-1116 ss-1]